MNEIGNNYTFFSRIHFRYNRNSFPQDLVFQVTPNNEQFQARYVLTHAATGNLDCEAGRAYQQGLKSKRRQELRNLVSLTGRTIEDYFSADQFGEEATEEAMAYKTILPELDAAENSHGSRYPAMAIFAVVMVSGAGLLRWKGLI
ncbi:MAG: hypothetical protein EAZ17_09910 [Sphingobacteriales bacterium]|nr:MAG: hypothetical protein EAZ17_09910 [Sphingobacteriales bacterium]